MTEAGVLNVYVASELHLLFQKISWCIHGYN